ncbi:hypothetical protein [Halorientalis regularis]|jgi:hypothetical protein|uniref:Uncharacterized protein n=1 Tax=Halorientalis regularis TaxID=660518 RepID=A0A1G7FL92_9EURY|nr:hypothetical protein [Halorientalis regularis]SDE76630.1 hypothetical protein SAMN05216218_101244 [Halorientalis regularis]
MSGEFPSSWTDPTYVSTVVMVLAAGALLFYAALTPGNPAPETVGFVLLWISAPATVAYELARRFG